MRLFGKTRTIGLKPETRKHRFFFDTRYRPILRKVINSDYFTTTVMFVIMMNAVTIAVAAHYSLDPNEKNIVNVLDKFDYVFFVIYFAEFVLKLYVYQVAFWENSSYIFELFILIIMLVQMIINQGEVMAEDGSSSVIVNILDLFKAVRIFRTILFFEGVQVLLNALVNTVIKSSTSVLTLLLLLFMFFAVIGYYSFGFDFDTGNIYEEWGTFVYSLISLLTYLFAEGWVPIQTSLNAKYPGSEFFGIVFILLGNFIFINLFIGVIIMNIHDATERHAEACRKEREMQLQLKKEYLYKRQHDDVHKMLEKQKHHQYDNFEQMTKSFYGTLRNDDYVLMSDNSSNLMWLETFIDSLQHLDVYTYRAQQSHRNIAIAIAEMAERHYKTQFGIVGINESFIDRMNMFDPYNQQTVRNKLDVLDSVMEIPSNDVMITVQESGEEEEDPSVDDASKEPLSPRVLLQKRTSDGFPAEGNLSPFGDRKTTSLQVFPEPKTVVPRRGTVGTLLVPTIVIEEEEDEENEDDAINDNSRDGC